MKLYWAPHTRSIRVIWMLEETGVPYERAQIDIRSEASKSDSGLRAASPMGKVPALEDGPVKIWDSGAICGYLADQYPAKQLAPPIGHKDRGAYLMWLMFTNAAIEPSMVEKVLKLEPAPTRNGWGSWDQTLNILRTALARGPWILGEKFCAADVLLGMSCVFLRQFKMIGDEPVLDAYAARCLERPAFKRALEIEAAAAT